MTEGQFIALFLGLAALYWVKTAPRGFMLALLIVASLALALMVPAPMGWLICIALLLGVLINWKWELI